MEECDEKISMDCASERSDTLPKPTTKVEHVYRTRPVTHRHFVGEDRMEASLHYLRGRTDALLNQVSDSSRPSYAPRASSSACNASVLPRDIQLNYASVLKANVIHDPPRSTPTASRSGRRGPQQFSVEASLASLQANKDSLNQLYQQMASLKSTILEHDPPFNSRNSQSTPLTRSYSYRPSKMTRKPVDPVSDRLDLDCDRSYQRQSRAFSATPSTRLNSNERPLSRVSHNSSVYPPSRPPTSVRNASPKDNASSAYNPSKPSSFMRYLRNLRQTLMHKEHVEDAGTGTGSRPRNRTIFPRTSQDVPKNDVPSDYQPLRSGETFRPIFLGKPVAENELPPTENETAEPALAPMQAIDDLLDQEQDGFMEFGQQDPVAAQTADGDDFGVARTG